MRVKRFGDGLIGAVALLGAIVVVLVLGFSNAHRFPDGTRLIRCRHFCGRVDSLRGFWIEGVPLWVASRESLLSNKSLCPVTSTTIPGEADDADGAQAEQQEGRRLRNACYDG